MGPSALQELRQGSPPSPPLWVGLRCPFSQPFPEADAEAGDQEGTLRERVALPLLVWAGPEAGLVRQHGTLAGSPLDQTAESGPALHLLAGSPLAGCLRTLEAQIPHLYSGDSSTRLTLLLADR